MLRRKELPLAGNRISELPQEIYCLRNLQKLDLSYNELCELPQMMHKMENLEYIRALNYNCEELDTCVEMEKFHFM